MKRRHFLGAALALPAAARAQGRSGGKLGYVYVGPKEMIPSRVEMLAAGVRASGYALPPGDIVFRTTEGVADRLAPAIAEVLAQNVSVFVAAGPAALRVAPPSRRRALCRSSPTISRPIQWRENTLRASRGRAAT